MRSFLLVPLLILVALPAPAQPPARPAVEGTKGMVVCVSPLAADVGLDVLKKGGNAVDAAVAVAFALAVTWPEAGNIGGGGFMMVAVPGKHPVCIDYRETAPAAAKPDLFADGTVTWLDHKAAGVPGTVRGLEMAHKRWGRLEWTEVVRPAFEMAHRGFPVNEVLAAGLNRVLTDPKTTNPEFRRVYGKPGGGKWEAGDMLRLPDLSVTLFSIGRSGPDEFYTGNIGKQLADEMKAGGGLTTADDLAKYEAKERKPVHTTYRGYDVYGPPPPSSGGVAVAEMLNILENFDLAKHGQGSPEATHLLIEVMKRAYADRARFLGDPDFVEVPKHLTAKWYAKRLAAGIDPARATPSEAIAPELPLAGEGDSTTHFSVIDADGMAVSNTTTLENSYGNRVVVRGAGYILNNEMTDFNPKPGETTKGGRIGTPANTIRPGKRMLSSMSPTLVMKDGKPVLITGSPGGRTIPNTVLNVVVNTVDFGMTPAEAVAAPRVHHQWFPDVALVEPTESRPELFGKLKAKGHAVRPHRQGDAHTIGVDPKTGKLVGAADGRIDGKAAGY